MRAWRLHELGEPAEKLRLEQVDDLRPGAGQVLVDVAATGLTFPDVLMCQGRYQMPTQTPYTPGGEVAGTVREVGEGVTSLQPGDRVVTMSGKGLAEQVLASAAVTFRLPDGVDFEKAAALIVNYGTTYYALHDRGHLAEGETVLVTGAAGGTGTAAIQLGLAAGAKVIAVAGGAEKAQLCRDLGAHVVIDHRHEPDWVDAVKAETGGKGVDVAYDPVGGDTFHKVRRCMGWGGRLLVIGFVEGIPEAPVNHVLLKSYSIVGVYWGESLGRFPGSLDGQVEALLALTASGAIDPPVQVHDFADGAKALQQLADRAVVGKLVVRRS
jgi:NADPH2:quinone reductase